MPIPKFKIIERYCLNCGKELVLKNRRDIERKKFCSHRCCTVYTHKIGRGSNPPIMTKEIREIAAQTLKRRIAEGYPYKWKTNKQKKINDFSCKDCGKIINPNQTILCRTCFNKRKRKDPVAKIKKKPKHFKMYICDYCSRIYKKQEALVTGKNHFCSRKCQGLWQSENKRGKTGIGYIDGRTPIRKIIKNGIQYQEWRKKIFEKDHYKCINCGENSFIHAHHIRPFKEIFDIFMLKYNRLSKDELIKKAYTYKPFWDISNGKTLCYECHKHIHPQVNLFKRGKRNAISYAKAE